MNFEFIAGNLALDFANTVHSHGLPDPEDDLKTGSDLVDWGVQAGLWEESSARHRIKYSALQRSRKLRETLYALFAGIAAEGKAPAPALAAFNHAVSSSMAQASVQRSDQKYRLECRIGAGPLERLEFGVTRSALELLASDSLDRVRQCGDETCSWLFLDTSRNGKRSWCDMKTCGNRAKVRRFREREA